MNPAISVDIAHVDPNAAPLTINELIDILKPVTTATLTGATFLYYVMQSGTPSTDDQDKAWIELDASGRPLSVKIYFNGNWRRVYNGMVGEIRMFVGDPTDATIWTQPWNNTTTGGRGVIGGIYDGWQICNGNNGVADLRDNFIVAGSSYTRPNWTSKVDGTATPKQSGGVKDHMIVSSDLPPLDSVNGVSTLNLNGNEYKSPPESGHTNAVPIIDPNYANLMKHQVAIATYGSSPNGNPPVPQTPIPTLPPWVALGFIQFIGY